MTHSARDMTLIDKAISQFDSLLKTVTGTPCNANRSNPGANKADIALSQSEKFHVAGLMRVNHAGEVAAQALYEGHALVARQADIKAHMRQAAIEENDHLVWCAERLHELNSHTSYLGPLWYSGAFMIGMLAGMAGDKWGLGFVVETENQVSAHIGDHLSKLPAQEEKSRAILQQMQIDEQQHASDAIDAGAKELPTIIKWIMRHTAKVMTTAAYHA